MGKPLTPAQEQLRDNQISKNEAHIKIIDELLEEIEPFHQETLQYNSALTTLYETLNNAHSMLMQGGYADLYSR